ncbi:thioredoxin fold domain-containing protein [Hoyosella sp. G463]|uniref:Thioredoxin n=1 Tax=Lolliginicoccus lacisalsi TaxID=2742202 RepID=A0A927PL50_9ACTN|nr:thioredoxin domain-containing protein [Lolliginicoccus lacisalsi]MBD8506735.1 thioredoxin fold domain-containing protein [Lolliginicoccus lacisalsi]
MPAIAQVGNSDFWTKVRDSEAAAIVEFWGPWCGLCRAFTPTLEQFAEDNASQLHVFGVHVGNEPDIAAEYGVTSTPTTLVFHQGKVVRTMKGVRSRAELDAELAEFL